VTGLWETPTIVEPAEGLGETWPEADACGAEGDVGYKAAMTGVSMTKDVDVAGKDEGWAFWTDLYNGALS